MAKVKHSSRGKRRNNIAPLAILFIALGIVAAVIGLIPTAFLGFIFLTASAGQNFPEMMMRQIRASPGLFVLLYLPFTISFLMFTLAYYTREPKH